MFGESPCGPRRCGIEISHALPSGRAGRLGDEGPHGGATHRGSRVTRRPGPEDDEESIGSVTSTDQPEGPLRLILPRALRLCAATRCRCQRPRRRCLRRRSPRREPRRLGPALAGGHELVHRRPVDRLADDVGVPGVPGELLDEVHRDPAHRPRVDVLREPRGVARHGHRGAEVGAAEDLAGHVALGARGRPASDSSESSSVTRKSSPQAVACSSRDRSGGAGASGAAAIRSVQPALARRDVLDEAADAERAGGRCEADLLLGQAEGDGGEGVALLVEVGDEALALVGDGWDVGCHGSCPLSVVAVGVEVTEQGDLCPVVDELAVDVEHELDARVLGPRALARAARLGEAASSQPRTPAVQAAKAASTWASASSAVPGVVEGEVVDLRSAEVAVHAGAEDADDDVREPPGDRRDRCGDGLGVGEVDGQRTAAALDLGACPVRAGGRSRRRGSAPRGTPRRSVPRSGGAAGWSSAGRPGRRGSRSSRWRSVSWSWTRLCSAI